MGGERLNSLAIINIERQFANAVDMNAVIDVFARRHGRTKYFFNTVMVVLNIMQCTI